jgi:hypothetical protein
LRGIDTTAAVLPFRRSDANLPDAGRLITALRQIGYSLEQAVADLVDNSINAGATSVLIRFLHDGNAIQAVAVVDDGCGMDEQGIRNAMRFGSREAADVGTLGKFGMGLKLASLSHAQTLNVYSTDGAAVGGRRWTLEGIRKGWLCERIRADVTRSVLDRKWGPINLLEGGTLVLWEDLDKLPSHRRGLKYTLGSLETRLRLHLGLCFHRFLESGSLRIFVDQLLISRVGQGMQSEIAPLNPFGYAASGNPDYPRKMVANLSGIGPLELETHIWPAKSEAPEYKLGRRSAARQGFYFYRNGRLIQAGGWNGLVQDETEPHGSLARVKVDLPVQYDADFGINVQKSTVLVPPVFAEVFDAVSEDGVSFEDFRRDAIQVYRSANVPRQGIGHYPEAGLNSNALEVLKGMYARPSDDQGFRIRWAKLREDEFFRLDRAQSRILLNRSLRQRAGNEVTKLLIAILMRNDLGGKLTRARERELEQLNELLLQSVS